MSSNGQTPGVEKVALKVRPWAWGEEVLDAFVASGVVVELAGWDEGTVVEETDITWKWLITSKARQWVNVRVESPKRANTI